MAAQHWPAVSDTVRERWEAEQSHLASQRVAESTWGGFDALALVGGVLFVVLGGASRTISRFTSAISCILSAQVDLSFMGDNPADDTPIETYKQRACASLVVLSFPSLDVVHERFEMVVLNEPYIPGFLAFREVPPLVKLIEELRTESPHMMPQVLFVDGNGILHPRQFGLACHMGVATGIPTLGAAKKMFQVDGLDKAEIKARAAAELLHAGDFFPLTGSGGTVWGAALRATDAINPTFVSPGHRIDLADCIELVRRCSRHRVAEPIRQADLRSRAVIRDIGF
jgi:deoxyinosine 3'endonuclease (endonuclease V)